MQVDYLLITLVRLVLRKATRLANIKTCS